MLLCFMWDLNKTFVFVFLYYFFSWVINFFYTAVHKWKLATIKMEMCCCFRLWFSNLFMTFPSPNLIFLCQYCKQDWNSKYCIWGYAKKMKKTWKQSLLFTTVQLILFKLRPRYEPPHDKTNKMTVHPAKTQISRVWSGSLLSAQWVAKDPSFLHADSLIWVFVDMQSFCWCCH